MHGAGGCPAFCLGLGQQSAIQASLFTFEVCCSLKSFLICLCWKCLQLWTADLHYDLEFPPTSC